MNQEQQTEGLEGCGEDEGGVAGGEEEEEEKKRG